MLNKIRRIRSWLGRNAFGARIDGDAGGSAIVCGRDDFSSGAVFLDGSALVVDMHAGTHLGWDAHEELAVLKASDPRALLDSSILSIICTSK